MVLSIKHAAVSEFVRSADQLQGAAGNWPDDSLYKFTTVLINSTAIFGETEHFAREAERCKILGVQRAREKFCSKMVAKKNAEGLAVLAGAEQALALMKDIVKNIKKGPLTKKMGRELKSFETGFADILVDSDIKPSDAGKVQKVVSDVVSIAAEKGVAGTMSLLEKKLDEYLKVRKQDDRGAVDNVPHWKIVAVALFLGVAVIAIIHCLGFGCRGSEISYAAALLVLGLIALFC